MATKRSPIVELFWRVHPALYRWSGGRIGGRLLGMPVLLLTTTGRRSGESRTTALTYFPTDGAFVVIASCLGEPRHPYWWLNLKAQPNATIQVGRERIPVRAREAEGAERETLWQAVVTTTPDYDEYKQRTTRRIPVVVLERI